MGLAGVDELAAAYSSLFRIIATQHVSYITWQEFMSFLLTFDVTNSNNPDNKEGKENNNTTQNIKPKKKKMKPKELVYDSHGHLLTTAERLAIAKKEKDSAVNTGKPSNIKKPTATSVKPNEKGAFKGVAMDKVNNTNHKYVHGPLPSPSRMKKSKSDITPRTYVIGSQMNMGKLGGRHLQLHVFPSDC